MAHLVLEKVPVLSSTESLRQEEEVTSMKVELKMVSKVRDKYDLDIGLYHFFFAILNIFRKICV